MAHGWNSYMQSLSSDTSSLRVPLDTEENLVQQIESLIDHNDLSNLVGSNETPSAETNFFANPNSNSNYVDQKYYGDLPWSEAGTQQAIRGNVNVTNPFEDFTDGNSSASYVDNIKPSYGFNKGMNQCSSQPYVDNIKPSYGFNKGLHQLTESQETDNTRNESLREGLCTNDSSETAWAERLFEAQYEQKENLDGSQGRTDGVTCMQGPQPPSALHRPCALVTEQSNYKLDMDYRFLHTLPVASEYPCASEIGRGKNLDDASQNWKHEENDCMLDREETSMQADHTPCADLTNLSPMESQESPSSPESNKEEEQDDSLQDWEEKENDCGVNKKETLTQADDTPSVDVKNLSPLQSEEETNSVQETMDQREEDYRDRSSQDKSFSNAVHGTPEIKSVTQSWSEVDDDKRVENQKLAKQDEMHPTTSDNDQEHLTTSVTAANGDTYGKERKEHMVAPRKEDDSHTDPSFNDHKEDLLINECPEEEDMPASIRKQEDSHTVKIVDGQDTAQPLSGPKNHNNLDILRALSSSLCNSETQLPTKQVRSETHKEMDTSSPTKENSTLQEHDQSTPLEDINSSPPRKEHSPLQDHDRDSSLPNKQESTLQEHDRCASLEEMDSSSPTNKDSINEEHGKEMDAALPRKDDSTFEEHDRCAPLEEMDTSSPKKEDSKLQEHDMYSKRLPDSLRADNENGRDDFERHLADDGQEPPMPCEFYGEPLEDSFDELSRQDSTMGSNCEAVSGYDSDEKELKMVDDDEHKDDLTGLTPQWKSSLAMTKRLHPIVLLKTMEVKNETESFHCADCPHDTLNVDYLIEHHHCEHPQQTFQFCQTCDTYLTSKDFAENHVCGEDESTPVSKTKVPDHLFIHKCSICKRLFNRTKTLMDHKNSHSNPTPFKCHLCGTYYRKKQYLVRHLRTVQCQPTSAVASQKREKKSTVRPKAHPTDGLPDCYVKVADIFKTILCRYCMSIFPNKLRLKKHEYNVHWDKSAKKMSRSLNPEGIPVWNEAMRLAWRARKRGTYKCPLCPQTYTFAFNRTRHLRDTCIPNLIRRGKAKVGNRYLCPLCNATFAQVSNRKRHVDSCLKEFSKPERSKLETRKQNVDLLPTKEESSSPSQSKQLFKCKLCPAVYSYYSGLFRHKKKHELYKKTGKVLKYRRSIETEPVKDAECEEKNESSSPMSCEFCGKGFNNALSLKKHVRKHRGAKPYRCLECGKGFAKQTYLLAHKKIHQRRIQCTVCKKILPTLTDLIQHRQTHTKKGVLQCPDCPMQFQYPIFLLRHAETHKRSGTESSHQPKKPQQKLKGSKGESETFKCPVCKKVFEDPEALGLHCMEHSGPSSSECPVCKKRYNQRVSMLRHLKTHTGHKPYSCKNCKKGFFRKLTMEIHQRSCSGPEAKSAVIVSKTPHAKPGVILSKGPAVSVGENFEPQGKHKCSYCPRTFQRLTRVKKHHLAHKMSSTTIKPCSKCGAYYGMVKFKVHEENCSGIQTRPERDEDGSERFPCRICGKNFSRNWNRIVHEKKSCRSINITDNAVGKGSQGKDDKYKCPHCQATFLYKSYLLRHLKAHNREQYSCMRCGQKYTSQSKYLQHEAFCDGVNKESSSLMTKDLKAAKKQSRIAMEGDYKCTFCTKSFSRSRYLRRHILKMHNEVKPYRCGLCDTGFSRHDHYQLHQSRCKGKRRQLEVRIAKISLDDIGTGWQKNLNLLNKAQPDQLACTVCSKRFTSKHGLDRHFTLVHETVKPFKCSCGAKFTLVKSLRRHRKLNSCRRYLAQKEKNHESSSMKEGVTRELPSRETNRFVHREQLLSHRKLRYACTYCPRAFKGRDALRTHTRLHTGEKPYSCDTCGEKFIRRDYLQRHVMKCKAENMGSSLCERCGGCFSPDELCEHQIVCKVKAPGLRPKSGQSTTSSPPKGFSCANCSSRFLLFSQLQQHFLTKHRYEPLKATSQTQPLHQQLSNIMNIKEEPLDDGFEDTSLMPLDDELAALSDDPDPDSDKSLSCPHCEARFINKQGLSRHLLIHGERGTYNCKRCGQSFPNLRTHRKHSRNCLIKPGNIKVEGNTDTEITSEVTSTLNDRVLVFNQVSKTTGTGVLQTNFSCKDENDATKASSTRKQRKDSSSDKNKAVQYQCSECDQSFTDGLLLISHLEDHGREEQKLKLATCQKCGKRCSSPGSLDRHMKVHANDKSYSCPECSKTFLSPSELHIHRTCHDPNRPYVCTVCNNRFWNSQSLGKHYADAHAGVMYTCHICNKSYKIRQSLIRHCKNRHPPLQNEAHGPINEKETTSQQTSEEEEEEENNEEEHNGSDGSTDNDSDSEEDQFPCHVCGKTFVTSESLEDHQRCHTGEKPHECKECGKCFFGATQLQQHERSHKSEFQCQTCGRGFVSLFALRKHKHTHGKSRPHKCPKCHLSFVGPSQMAEHLATHREDNFPCDICDRTFSCKTSRAEHRKIHTEKEDAPRFDKEETSVPSRPAAVPSRPASSSDVEDKRVRCLVCNERTEQLSEHVCAGSRKRSSEEIQAAKMKINEQHKPGQPYTYQCTQCHMSFSYRKHYLHHLEKHDKSPAKAITLGESREVKAVKRTETKPVKKAEDKIYKCPICPERFAHAMELAEHLSIHSDNIYECKTCKLQFTSKSKLAEHERSHMTAATQYECTECGQNFLGKDAFRQHHCSRRKRADNESSHPSTSKPAVTSKPAPEEELLDVGEDFFNCLQCSKRFFLRHDLLEHQKKYHPSDEVFKCEHCEKTFTRKKYLRQHKRRVHSEEEERTQEKTTFKCSQCPKTFDLEQDLQMHLRKHAEREGGCHRCDMCYKSFSQLSRLREHQESHVGQVVYECTECDKAFAFPHLLDEHQLSHR